MDGLEENCFEGSQEKLVQNDLSQREIAQRKWKQHENKRRHTI